MGLSEHRVWFGLWPVFVIVALLFFLGAGYAQGQELTTGCTDNGESPAPVVVPVTKVPIVVTSTTDDYFVLYVKHDVDGTEVKQPVLAKRGEAGATTLAENIKALPAERYLVEKYLVADPADVDGDCVDDITELDDLGYKNPINAAPSLDINQGAVAIPDQNNFETLASTISRSRTVKLALLLTDNTGPRLYFTNTVNYPLHWSFLSAIGVEPEDVFGGSLIYDPDLVLVDGGKGGYRYRFDGSRWLSSNHSTAFLERIHALLAASMPLLEDNLVLWIPNEQLPYHQSTLALLRTSRVPLAFDEDLYTNVSFLSMNQGVGYGLLVAREPDERPHPHEIVIYETLPNELPLVSGIISTVPQTALSHVNLRAVQNGIPNAFIRGASHMSEVANLLGSYVRYEVTERGWKLLAATPEEVGNHYDSLRPPHRQTPERDLSVTTITPLSNIGFDDWKRFGVKAANLAVLRKLGFPKGTVPNGFAVPFYFYDEFMKTHGFYDRIKKMLADENFQTNFEVQDDMLDDLRDDIKDATTPQWIIDALTTMHNTFPQETSLRYRSSTNNEDLPGFNGAGLYDSYTQRPDETEEDGIDKSLKQVWASLWTLRAFTEREFHRIDHLKTAMGVLVHPNFSDELANGVAASFDPRTDSNNYYVNTQLGEDLVTNPQAHSIPEEVLLRKYGRYSVISLSNLVEAGTLLMSEPQMRQLRQYLEVIHDHFKKLYNPDPNEDFAMEIEFKITSDNILAIKQARPWVFGPPPPPPNSTPAFIEGTKTTRSVAENTNPATDIGSPVTATDLDQDSLTYTLGGTDAASFNIIQTTGQLQTKTALDYESRANYTVTVSVTDGKDSNGVTDLSTDDTITVTIYITDVDESPDPPPDNNRGNPPPSRGGFDPRPVNDPVFDETPTLAPFTDVDPRNIHAPNILTLHVKGLTTGCSTKPLRFCPQKPITRAQMATFLARALELNPAESPAGFIDIEPESTHTSNIQALYAAGITGGCSTKPLRFCPQEPVTRAQMATFLARALELKTTTS